MSAERGVAHRSLVFPRHSFKVGACAGCSGRCASNRLARDSSLTCRSPFLIGIGAGLASAALFASAWTGTVLGMFVLFFLSPMPVAIAGLGWGWGAGAVAAATGALVVLASAAARDPASSICWRSAPRPRFSPISPCSTARPMPTTAADGRVVSDRPDRRVGDAVGRRARGGWRCSASAATSPSVRRLRCCEMLEKSLFAGRPPAPAAAPADGQNRRTRSPALMTAVHAVGDRDDVVRRRDAQHVGRRACHARSGRLTRPWPDLSALTLPPAMPLAFGVVGARR